MSLKRILEQDRVVNGLAWFVIAIAFGIRIWNIGLGGPSVLAGSDEYYIVHSARSLFEPGNWYPKFAGPHNLAQPDLPEYLTYFIAYAVYKIGFWAGAFTIPTQFLTEYRVGSLDVLLAISRVLCVFSGSATVVACYYLGRKFYNVRVGLVAATITSLGWYNFFYSKIGMYDAHVTLLILLSYFFTYRIFQQGQTKDYIWAGILGGLATACKYTGVFTAIPILTAHILAWRCYQQRLVSLKPFVAALAAAFAFVLTVPYAIWDFSGLLASYDMLMGYQAGEARAYSWDHLREFWVTTLGTNLGFGFRFCFMGGIVLLLVRHKPKDLLLLSLPVVFILVNSRTLVGFYARILQTIVPVCALVAGVFLDWCIQAILKWGQEKGHFLKTGNNLQRWANVCVVGCLIWLAYTPLKERIEFNLMIGRAPIQSVGNQWVNDYLPQGARILCDRGTISPDNRKFDVLLDDLSLRDLDFYAQAIAQYHYIVIGNFPVKQAFWDNLKQDAVLVKEIRGSKYRKGYIQQADHIQIYAPYRRHLDPFVDFVHQGGRGIEDEHAQRAWRLPLGDRMSAPLLLSPGQYTVSFQVALSHQNQPPVTLRIAISDKTLKDHTLVSAQAEKIEIQVQVEKGLQRIELWGESGLDQKWSDRTFKQVLVDSQVVGEMQLTESGSVRMAIFEQFPETLRGLREGDTHMFRVEVLELGLVTAFEVPAIDIYDVHITPF